MLEHEMRAGLWLIDELLPTGPSLVSLLMGDSSTWTRILPAWPL